MTVAADRLFRVKLTTSFLEQLASIEAFLTEADATFAHDDLLAGLRGTVIRNLARLGVCLKHCEWRCTDALAVSPRLSSQRRHQRSFGTRLDSCLRRNDA